MGRWILGFLSLAIAGGLFAAVVPRFAVVGVLVAALASVAMLQVTLTAIAARISGARNATSTDDETLQNSDFARLMWAYQDFKLFLGRLVGIVGLMYGIVTHILYFALLGAAATVLFWILDRRIEWSVEDLQCHAELSRDREDVT